MNVNEEVTEVSKKDDLASHNDVQHTDSPRKKESKVETKITTEAGREQERHVIRITATPDIYKESAERVVWIVRHGQREDNINKKWRKNAPRGAWDDPPLSEHGLKQADECGIRLADEDFGIILCSPFLRCVQTAQKIAQKHSKQMKICIEPGICETLCSTQFPPGCLSTEQLSQIFPEIDLNYKAVVPNFTPESDILDCRTRLKTVLEETLRRQKGSILLVTHGSPAAMVHELLTGVWHYVGQCTISKIVADNAGTFKAVMANDSTHLSVRTNLRDHEFSRPV